MALKDGIMRCSGNLGGLTSLLTPYIKHMFQLLDALSALLDSTAAAGGGAGTPPPKGLLLLLLHPFAKKNAPAGRGLTSLLKPYKKHMFQLLDATAAAAGGGGDGGRGGGGGLPPACYLLTAACRLLPCCCFSILLP